MYTAKDSGFLFHGLFSSYLAHPLLNHQKKGKTSHLAESGNQDYIRYGGSKSKSGSERLLLIWNNSSHLGEFEGDWRSSPPSLVVRHLGSWFHGFVGD